MTRTIFRNTFLVGVSVLVLCAGLFFGMQYTQIQDETYAVLQQEAVYAEQGLLMGGIPYLRALNNENRITWIDAAGTVLYDNDFPLPMPSQNEMPEVRQALTSGEGKGIRRSESSGEVTMYYSLRCEDGSVLRLGRSLRAVQDALLAVSPVLWVLMLVLIISGVLAFRVANQIVRPINEMDLEHPEITPYPELSPLVDKIQEQKLTILEEAEQREAIRREFSANVSHELKTPLTSISGFAELMAEGVVQGDKVQEFGRDIYQESQRLIALINDIIRLSQLDEQNVEPLWESLDLYELAGSVLDSLRPAADRRNIVLNLAGAPAIISGVYPLVSEMVYNLCDNAIKYNHPGGLVTVTVSQQEGRVVLAVADTGIGISPEHQKRVFERFYRVDKSHSREVGGTGLGLSIVKHGAQFHGAVVQLESVLEKGTTVMLKFPASSEVTDILMAVDDQQVKENV